MFQTGIDVFFRVLSFDMRHMRAVYMRVDSEQSGKNMFDTFSKIGWKWFVHINGKDSFVAQLSFDPIEQIFNVLRRRYGNRSFRRFVRPFIRKFAGGHDRKFICRIEFRYNSIQQTNFVHKIHHMNSQPGT